MSRANRSSRVNAVESAETPDQIFARRYAEVKEQGIDRVLRIVEGGFQESFVPLEYQKVYSKVYNMCTERTPRNFTEDIYNKHGEWFADWHANKVLPRFTGLSGDALLKSLAEAWTNHTKVDKHLNTFLYYVNRYHVTHNGRPTLSTQANYSFFELVYRPIHVRMTSAILAKINAERDGEGIDRDMIKTLTGIYVEVSDEALEVYERDFQTPMLAAVQEYYQRKGNVLVADMDVPSYLAKIEEMIITESARVRAYMHESSEPYVRHQLEIALLKNQQKWVLENERSGVVSVLSALFGTVKDDKVKRETLARLYRLYKSDVREAAGAGAAGPASGGLLPIANILKERLSAAGMLIYQSRDNASLKEPGTKDSSENPKFVLDLLELHDRARTIVKEDFKDDQIFQKAVKDAFEHVINKQPTYSEFLNLDIIADYSDALLKADKKILEVIGETSDITKECTRVVALFKFIQDKDMFGDSFRSLLSKRLLSGKSSTDNERAMIGLLKFECGAGYTTKMEGMINDLHIAEQLQGDFLKESAGSEHPYDFRPTVLTSGFWPTMPKDMVVLPSVLLAQTRAFETWYAGKSERRKLVWVLTQGTVDIKATYGSKSYVLSLVNAIQATVLLLFNEPGSFSTKDIEQRLGFKDVKRFLFSLLCGKAGKQMVKLINKEPDDTKITDACVFSVNSAFSSSNAKLPLALPSVPQKRDRTAVDGDRIQQIDAAIVRISKARKSLKYAELVQLTVEQLQRMFKVDVRLLKSRIEDLIERVS